MVPALAPKVTARKQKRSHHRAENGFLEPLIQGFTDPLTVTSYSAVNDLRSVREKLALQPATCLIALTSTPALLRLGDRQAIARLLDLSPSAILIYRMEAVAALFAWLGLVIRLRCRCEDRFYGRAIGRRAALRGLPLIYIPEPGVYRFQKVVDPLVKMGNTAAAHSLRP
jgi:hypothetical protein